MTEATPNNNAPPADAAPARTEPSLLNTPADNAPVVAEMPANFEGGAEAWGKLDEAGKTGAVTAFTEKAKAESTARTDAYAKAEGKDAKLAAYTALSKDEKAAAFKAMPDEVKKELGVEDPAIPVYTEFKLPEGFTADAEQLAPAVALFKKSGLSQEQAQEFIDLAAGREKAAAEKSVNAFVELQNKWVGEIKADPEIGGDKLKPSLAHAARAIDRLAIPGLKEALDLTGAGNNPSVVKAFVRLGQLMSEDRFQPGNGAPPAAPKSPAQAIYGDSGPKQSADA